MDREAQFGASRRARRSVTCRSRSSRSKAPRLLSVAQRGWRRAPESWRPGHSEIPREDQTQPVGRPPRVGSDRRVDAAMPGTLCRRASHPRLYRAPRRPPGGEPAGRFFREPSFPRGATMGRRRVTRQGISSHAPRPRMDRQIQLWSMDGSSPQHVLRSQRRGRRRTYLRTARRITSRSSSAETSPSVLMDGRSSYR